MNNVMEQDIKKVLISEEEIRAKVEEIGARITEDYAGKNLLLVGILKGSVVFMADLMRAIGVHARIDFMHIGRWALCSCAAPPFLREEAPWYFI